MWSGATPRTWSVVLVAAPLAVGWMAQALVGSWTHLIPAIGPGDPVVHARQRRRLGWASVPRWAMWNGGLMLVMAGSALGNAVVGGVGAAAIAGSLVLALSLLVASIVLDPRGSR
jgi:hypothetical protein